MFKNQLQISTCLWKHATGNFNFEGTKIYTLKAFKVFVMVSAHVSLG